MARLRAQIPEAGFPRGAGVASAVAFVLLLLIAAFTALYLSTAGPLALIRANDAGGRVPDELTAGQQRTTAGLAQSVATSATAAAGDLQVAAGSSVFDTPDDTALLTRLGETYEDWRGVVVYDPVAQKVVATRGEPVPVETLRGVAVANLTVRPVARPGDTPLVLTALPLTGARAGKLLVVSTALRNTAGTLDEDTQQQVRLVTADGVVLHTHGSAVAATDRPAQDLLARAATAAAAGQSGVLTGAAVTEKGKERAPVVSYAPVSPAGIGGSLGLSVVTFSRFPVEAVPVRWPGLVPAAALLALAVGGFVLLRRTVVAPIRRLRDDALAVAAGELGHPVRQSRIREVNRVTAALEHTRSKLRRRKPEPEVRPLLSAQLAVVLVALALLGWSGAVAATLGRQHAEVSPTMLSEHGVRVTRSADTLRRSLTEGLNDLQTLARLGKGKQPDQLRDMLGRLAGTESRFRSVYVTDAEGAVLVQAGREALRDPGKLPGGEGLRQHNTSGRVPVVYAFTPLPDSPNVLVGEYDVPRMAELLGSAGGRVRVVDEGKRTIADTEGYLAFAALSDPALVKNVDAAQSGKDAREATPSALLAAQRLADKGQAATLKWVVVAEQPIGSLGLADNTVRSGARVAALLTAVVALLLFAWHLLVVVRPLRRIGTEAGRIADGNTAAVVYPQRQDEIGTVASCVEICRQALTEGHNRLGETRRPTGAATDETELLQKIVDEPEPEAPAKRPSPTAETPDPAGQRRKTEAPIRAERKAPAKRPSPTAETPEPAGQRHKSAPRAHAERGTSAESAAPARAERPAAPPWRPAEPRRDSQTPRAQRPSARVAEPHRPAEPQREPAADRRRESPAPARTERRTPADRRPIDNAARADRRPAEPAADRRQEPPAPAPARAERKTPVDRRPSDNPARADRKPLADRSGETPARRPAEYRKRPQTPPRIPVRTPDDKAKSDYLSWLDGAGV
ncbi:HAMP domain-containing protein [Amycolatopsis sp. NEAU-NG30]|uniref:HAMP domain-containing protein n=1 Tax=Amycolatopsis melonis TaxID=3156488 RepID=A0ABV0LQ36_9PSEU